MVAILLNQCAIGGTILPKVDDTKYTNYGEKHECVLKIKCYVLKDGVKYHYIASCVLIKPTIILTAAHVISESNKSVIIHENEEIEIDLSLYPSSFDEDEKSNKISPNDIAIGHLIKPITISYYPELYENQDELNKICSISGFGNSGTHDIGCFRVDGKKRAGSNRISSVTDGMLECSLLDRPNTELEFLIANGDSGGGLFIANRLAGINSSIYTSHKDKKLNSDYNDRSLHTRISTHKNWIDRIIKIIETTMDNKE
jgi:hypothetical protein